MPPLANDPHPPGGKLAPGLRVATHNVRGLRGAVGPHQLAKVHTLFNEWHRLRLHVVLLQEIKVGYGDVAGQRKVERALAQAAAAAGSPGYKVVWGCRKPTQTAVVGGGGRAGRRKPAGPASGGVAILIRKDLSRSQELQVVAGSAVSDEDGRMQQLKIW